MKKYILQQTIEAKPMVKSEAESKLGHDITNGNSEERGFLTCDMDNLQFGWVTESQFNGKPFDTPHEQMYYLHNKLEEWQTFFRSYTKENKMSQDERLQVYLINRHLKSLVSSLSKILNIEQIKAI